MSNRFSSILIWMAVLSPSVSFSAILIDVGASNSVQGVVSTVNISGSLDTASLVIKDLSEVPADLAGTGIGVGVYPYSNTRIAGIYSGRAGSYSFVYNGLLGQSGSVTTSQSSVQASVSVVDSATAGFGFDNQYIYLGSNYISGSPLQVRMDFAGKTPAELGFAAGTRSWTVGVNVITLRVSSAILPPPLAVSPLTPTGTSEGGQVTLATTGGSGGNVIYSASASRTGPGALVCTITGNVLTVSGGSGTCLITAIQPPSGGYTESTTSFNVAVAASNPDPRPIPTLSEWAQIMMMFLMIATVGFAGWRLKPR